MLVSVENNVSNREKKTDSSPLHLKEAVSVILSDPPCKDGNARFTTVPLKIFYSRKTYWNYQNFKTLGKPSKITMSSTLLIILIIQLHPCKPDILTSLYGGNFKLSLTPL